MNTPRSIDGIMNEMNDQARAQGRYLDKAFWEIPSRPGSILDVPETAKSREDLAWFRARRMERRKAAGEEINKPVETVQNDVTGAIHEQLQQE